MLQTGTMDEGDEMLLLDLIVRSSDRLPIVFKFWMAELARDHFFPPGFEGTVGRKPRAGE